MQQGYYYQAPQMNSLPGQIREYTKVQLYHSSVKKDFKLTRSGLSSATCQSSGPDCECVTRYAAPVLDRRARSALRKILFGRFVIGYVTDLATVEGVKW